jgi:Replication factor C.
MLYYVHAHYYFFLYVMSTKATNPHNPCLLKKVSMLIVYSQRLITLGLDIKGISDVSSNIDEATKRALTDKTGQYEWRISQGADEKLQMHCYLNSLVQVVNRYKKRSNDDLTYRNL